MTPEHLREVPRISSSQHREKIIMSYHQITITNAKSADSARIHHVLQQSIDHYPRLAALSFTLPEGQSDNTPASLVRLQRFQAEVYRRLSNYKNTRTTAGKPSSPTLLRWLWGRGSQMLLLFNLTVCYHPRHDISPEAGLQSIASLLEAAWNVSSTTSLLNEIVPFQVERSNPDGFERQLAALKEVALQMVFPVMTACSGPVK